MRSTRVVVDRPCVDPGVTFEEREGGRFCLSCREMQHDLTNATRREALALIEKNGGRICGTFAVGPSGEVRFRPEPPTRANAARGAALAFALAGCGSPSEPSAPTPTTIASPPSTTSTPDPPATIAVDPDTTDHSTDASSDVGDHQTHTHTHSPALVGMGPGVSMHISGGATARPPDEISGASTGVVTEPRVRGAVRADYAHIVVTGDGTLDHAVVGRLLATRQAYVRACYERELRNNPSLGGRIVVAMSVAESGAVSETSATENTTGNDTIAACVCSGLRRLRFPAPDGGPVSFTIDYTLSPTQ